MDGANSAIPKKRSETMSGNDANPAGDAKRDGAKLHPVDPMLLAKQLLDRVRQSSENDCIMWWKGTKVPRGAMIDGVPVAWAQHGIIRGPDGQELAYYDRMREFAGPNGDEHALLITTMKPVPVIAPDGKVCQAGQCAEGHQGSTNATTDGA